MESARAHHNAVHIMLTVTRNIHSKWFDCYVAENEYFEHRSTNLVKKEGSDDGSDITKVKFLDDKIIDFLLKENKLIDWLLYHDANIKLEEGVTVGKQKDINYLKLHYSLSQQNKHIISNNPDIDAIVNHYYKSVRVYQEQNQWLLGLKQDYILSNSFTPRNRIIENIRQLITLDRELEKNLANHRDKDDYIRYIRRDLVIYIHQAFIEHFNKTNESLLMFISQNYPNVDVVNIREIIDNNKKLSEVLKEDIEKYFGKEEIEQYLENYRN
ncbi:MAG: hypothetical protein ACK5WP_03995 [Neisseriaceae bacterium]